MVSEVLGAMKIVQGLQPGGREQARFADAVDRDLRHRPRRIMLRSAMTAVVIA
jgi:ATP-binding cassette, subfamily B, bacterial